jgi:hypothetical protein
MKHIKSINELFGTFDKKESDKNQLKLDFNEKSEYNGIIYCSSKKKKGEYYLIFILDKSSNYLNNLEINSIGSIRVINDDISGEFERITSKEVPVSDTFLIKTLEDIYDKGERKVVSYGFMVYDDIITDGDIKKTIEYINSNKVQGDGYPDRTYDIIKSEKVNYDGRNLKHISDVF